MGTKKLNTEVEEVEQAVDACQTSSNNDVLDALCDSGAAYSEYRDKIDISAFRLFDCIKESLKDLDDLYWKGDTKAVIDWGCFLIDNAPWYEDIPDHISGHISKDLWKGYVMGFEKGRAEATMRHRTDIEEFDAEYDDHDDCIIIPESEITNVFSELECCHDVTVRYLPDDEYDAYIAKKEAEQQEWNACVNRCRESGDYSEMRQMMGIEQPEKPTGTD